MIICFATQPRPNPDFRYQLHRYLRLGVNLVQVKNQLRQVFNRMNIVVGAAKSVSLPVCPAQQHGDVGADLLTRQLTAFSGFGTLGDLISSCLAFIRYSGVTPKRPAATCLIDEEAVSPLRKPFRCGRRRRPSESHPRTL